MFWQVDPKILFYPLDPNYLKLLKIQFEPWVNKVEYPTPPLGKMVSRSVSRQGVQRKKKRKKGRITNMKER